MTPGQEGKPDIIEGFEMKDTLNAQHRSKEQGQDEATRLLRTPKPLGQRALGDMTQREGKREQEKGASEMGAPKPKGRSSSVSLTSPRSGRSTPSPYALKKRRNV